jgi:citrate synthase
MEAWRTAITDTADGRIRLRGHAITDLMTSATFPEVVFLLTQSRLPSAGERRMLDAILIAVADHGPGSPSAAAARMVASGNRQSFEAAIAAGILAIGDAHGGAGQACMERIAAGVALCQDEGLTLEEAARRVVAEAVASGRRLPGLGHRTHTEDPRTVTLFRLAEETGVAGEGIAFLKTLEAAAREHIRPLPINVDGAIAAVLYDLGFAPPLAKAVFILGRTAGLTAQIMEEVTREKPMRIHIPVEYDGP